MPCAETGKTGGFLTPLYVGVGSCQTSIYGDSWDSVLFVEKVIPLYTGVSIGKTRHIWGLASHQKCAQNALLAEVLKH